VVVVVGARATWLACRGEGEKRGEFGCFDFLVNGWKHDQLA